MRPRSHRSHLRLRPYIEKILRFLVIESCYYIYLDHTNQTFVSLDADTVHQFVAYVADLVVFSDGYHYCKRLALTSKSLIFAFAGRLLPFWVLEDISDDLDRPPISQKKG